MLGQHWHDSALAALRAGTYGPAPLIDVTSRRQRYVGFVSPLAGDLCDLYPVEGQKMLLKLVRDGRNNDLMQAEARHLQQISRAQAGKTTAAHFPALLDAFVLRDANGQRQANVLRREANTVSLADVLRAYPAGIDTADAAWMFNRLMTALAIAHQEGIAHGAVLPEHMLIRPSDHNGILIDWCYSVVIGQPLAAISPDNAAAYPPEVAARLPFSAAGDIYMAAGCLARLLGSNDGEQLPSGVPAPIRALLRACRIPAPQRRVQSAWQLFDDFQTILRDLYGPPRFRPFVMGDRVTG
jgi:serine/threonine protein kinase